MFINTHSCYSFKYGLMKPKELLEEMAERGVKKFALTDINSTAGSLSFVRQAEKYNITPVLGIDFRNGADPCYVGLAKNNEGFYELNRYLSRYLHEEKAIPASAQPFQHAFVVYPFHKYSGKPLRENEYLGIAPGQLGKVKFSHWKHYQDKMVAMHPVTFRHKRDFNAHRLLRAIDNNTLLSKLASTEQSSPQALAPSLKAFLSWYEEFPQIIYNTQKILDECTISFEFGEDIPHKNQKTYTGSERQDYELIRKLCDEGLEYRYEKVDDKIINRLETELKLIQEKSFMAYFLINWDIVRYAWQNDYPYVGRGSGANSLVAYLLRITDVDPIELDLYFERFINLYRKNPPDFDIDFSSRDRNVVTKYIFDRFPNTALLAAYNTFQYRAIVRELGKVFGLPPGEIDRLSESGTPSDQLSALVLKYGSLIDGLPSHLSIHAGGILISEKPIHYYSATNLPPKGFPTVQFDMLVAEDIGLYKFDILGQRGLSKIKDSLKIIQDNNPDDEVIDIHNVRRFYRDERVKSLLREGKAIGCFYVESPAMRMLLKKLKADTYLGLVAASSIIRPGVSKSGMMREYILRFQNPGRVEKEAHPVLLDIMPETFGVMVYQEDVIKVAHFFAGLTLGEADVLRRGMSGKYRSRDEFRKVKQKFFENSIRLGRGKALTTEIWRQIESFAGYAFAKGHSASYAVESYQSLFLKAYYPLEYMVATVNCGGGFYSREIYLHEARMHGAAVEAPCVNRSQALCTIAGKTIFLGLAFIKDIEEHVVRGIMAERLANGAFLSLRNFVDRMGVSLEQVKLLVRVGAFRFTGKSKKELLWDAYFLLGNEKKSYPVKKLFESPAKGYSLPELFTAKHEDAFEEMELLGFPLSDPFDLLKNQPRHRLTVSQFPQYLGREVTLLGYLVTIKDTKASSGKKMHFGTFLDIEGHFIDTTHFPPVAAKYPFRGKGIYTITGIVVEEFGFYSLEVTGMEKEELVADPRYFDEHTSRAQVASSAP